MDLEVHNYFGRGDSAVQSRDDSPGDRSDAPHVDVCDVWPKTEKIVPKQSVVMEYSRFVDVHVL
jgi:hypothetical protein